MCEILINIAGGNDGISQHWLPLRDDFEMPKPCIEFLESNSSNLFELWIDLTLIKVGAIIKQNSLTCF